jgi:HD-GYP domain-containing protein (c-di-GMP phosphodiesterase class II)
MSAPSCRECGAPISAPPFAHRDDGYSCERCYLASHDARAGRREDELLEGFAEALVAALDAREHETGLHSKRVACHTLILARRFTDAAPQLRQVYWGALLHDIGKIGIPDAILLKHGALDPAEWQVMRRHPQIGYDILSAAGFVEAAQMALTHEERFDGSGYPHGLTGEAIPLWSRLFAVIDALDAMTSDRPYRKGVSFEAAKRELVACNGRQFDPLAIDAFRAEEATLRDMVAMKCAAAPEIIP